MTARMTIAEALDEMAREPDASWTAVRDRYARAMDWRDWEKLYGIVRHCCEPHSTHKIAARAKKELTP